MGLRERKGEKERILRSVKKEKREERERGGTSARQDTIEMRNGSKTQRGPNAPDLRPKRPFLQISYRRCAVHCDPPHLFCVKATAEWQQNISIAARLCVRLGSFLHLQVRVQLPAALCLLLRSVRSTLALERTLLAAEGLDLRSLDDVTAALRQRLCFFIGSSAQGEVTLGYGLSLT